MTSPSCDPFTGEYEHTIDAKHRLAIPAELRALLDPEHHGDGFYLAPGPNSALWLWPQRTFQALSSTLEQTLLPAEELMEYEQLLFSQANRLPLDSAGRIRLPERMIRRFSLGQRVTVLGVNDHLELHDAERWDRQRDEKLDMQREIIIRARQLMDERRRGED